MNYSDWFDGFLHGKTQALKLLNEYLFRNSSWRDTSPIFDNTLAGKSKVCDIVRLEEFIKRYSSMLDRQIELNKKDNG